MVSFAFFLQQKLQKVVKEYWLIRLIQVAVFQISFV